MPVDFQIALCLDLQIHMSMPGKLRQHVIEKRNSRVDRRTGPCRPDSAHLDIGFLRLAGFGYDAGFFHRFILFQSLSSASRNRLFSSGVPTVTRNTVPASDRS